MDGFVNIIYNFIFNVVIVMFLIIGFIMMIIVVLYLKVVFYNCSYVEVSNVFEFVGFKVV